jgi:hypothetical protein
MLNYDLVAILLANLRVNFYFRMLFLRFASLSHKFVMKAWPSDFQCALVFLCVSWLSFTQGLLYIC